MKRMARNIIVVSCTGRLLSEVNLSELRSYIVLCVWFLNNVFHIFVGLLRNMDYLVFWVCGGEKKPNAVFNVVVFYIVVILRMVHMLELLLSQNCAQHR